MTKEEKMEYVNAKPIAYIYIGATSVCLEIMDVIDGFTPKVVVRFSDEPTRLHRVKLHNKWRRMECVGQVFTLYNHVYSMEDAMRADY